MWALLERGLRGDLSPIAAESAAEWFERFAPEIAPDTPPAETALFGGLLADRLGYAFAAGYQAALRALLPALPIDHRTSLCATESGGNHPRAIRTNIRLEGKSAVVSGHKRWSTLAPLAERLLVVATHGADASGRPKLSVVMVPAGAPGVTIQPMPDTPFVPEIPHAEIQLDDVRVSADAVLPGDGYATLLKPFRTIEDVHVHLALLGYLLSAARRSGAAGELREAIAASVVAARALAEAPVDAPAAHVALAGVLASSREIVERVAPALAAQHPEEGARFERDRGLLAVAEGARGARLQRAWERLSAGPGLS